MLRLQIPIDGKRPDPLRKILLLLAAVRYGLHQKALQLLPFQEHIAHLSINLPLFPLCLRHPLYQGLQHLIVHEKLRLLPVKAPEPPVRHLRLPRFDGRPHPVPQDDAAVALLKAFIGNRGLEAQERFVIHKVILVNLPVIFRVLQGFLQLAPLHVRHCQVSGNHGLHHLVRFLFPQVPLPFLDGLIIAVQLHIAIDLIGKKGSEKILIIYLPLPEQPDAIQGHLQGLAVLLNGIVLLGQLQGMLHVARIRLMLLQKQADIPQGMGAGILGRPIGVAVMMHIGLEFLRLALDPVETLVDAVDELHIRLQLRHAPHQQVAEYASLQIQVIALGVDREPIVSVFPRAEELDNLSRILKPLVVVQEQEPLPLRLLQPGVPRLGKVPAPLEINDIVCVLLNDAPDLLPAARIHQNQLRGDFLQ